MTISVRASDIRRRSLQAGVGDIAYADHSNELLTLINKDPQAKRIETLTVGGAFLAGTVYTFSINGFELSYTSVAGDVDLAGVAAKIKALIDADLRVRGQVEPSAALAVVTLTATYPGIDFELAESDANLAVALVQSGAEADAVPFGVLCCSLGFEDNVKLGFKAAAAKFVAQEDTLTVTYAIGEVYEVEIDIDGEKRSVSVDADTNDDTTAAAIEAAINLMMPAASVDAAVVTNVVTLSSEVAGKPFKVSIGLKSGTAARLVLAHTVSGAATDLNKAAAGVSLKTYDVEGAEYPANAGVKACRKGKIWVASSQAVSFGEPVFVELDGADAGKFFNNTTATRVRLEAASWELDSRESADGIAMLKLSL